DGSASSTGSAPDYTGTSAGVLNFAAGQTTASFTVTALSDLTLESPETVNLVLFGGNVGSSPSILTINDVAPTGTTVTPTPTPAPTTVPTYYFSAANYNVNEGSTAGITINRSGNLSQPSAILFRTGDGSASSPADYNSVTQGVFFAAGQSSAQVSVQTLFDSIPEPTETVNLFLSGGSLASPSLAVLSIIDPTAVAPTSFFYGSSPDPITDGGSGTFTINRTGNTSVSASVDYLIAPPTVPGQPFNFIDYTISPFGNFTGGTVNFNPGQTSVSLTITNNPGLTGGNVGLGFGPGTNAGIPGNTTITLI
ncbi:Calx-beta domain-containing protein, partial [Microcoleus sp. F4-D5]|uniref:Calx-beta domain-containing protein n=1 Tax=Microcoleus sp. F4-D5 TaxID=2818760 RepID=UPI002FD5FB2A